MPYSNFPSGFLQGVTIRGLPVLQTHTGNIFWVGNATANSLLGHRGASNNNRGTFADPFSTIAYAVTQCVANRGDIILVKPGHAETYAVASSLTIDVAGIAIIGLGVGSLRPTITMSAAASTIAVAASNVTVNNILFLATFVDVVTCFNVANAQVAKELVIDSCEFRDTGTALDFLSVLKVGTTANICDGLTFSRNKIYSLQTTGTIQSIILASIVDRLYVGSNYANYTQTSGTVACFLGLGTSLNHTNLLIEKNRILTPKTDSSNGAAVGGSGTMTGVCYDNYVANLDATTAIWIPTGLGLMFVQNFAHITGAVDKNALVNPAAA